ncbi:putative ABC transporter ATP-binding protein [Clostridia bacterium]|nr:putative ABC transporter ATP-binding protein [Clostridia bacterium]
MLRVTDLSVVYPDGTIGIDNLSLSITDGESVALIGANGAGKTTLMLALEGVIPITRGEIDLDGITLSKKTISQIRSRVGMVFQNPDDQLFMASIYDDIAFGPRNAGLDESAIADKVEEVAHTLNISHMLKRSALKLSGGEKRLSAIASVLSMDPTVLLFDEPTAFLDMKARRNLIGVLNAMRHTKLIASHDLTFIVETCARAVIIKDGTVFADDAVCSIIHNHDLMQSGGLEAI